MSEFRRRVLYGPGVKLALAHADPDDAEEFFVLMERLTVNPLDPALGVMRVRDKPSFYYVRFDTAVAVYEIGVRDHPMIRVDHITWF